MLHERSFLCDKTGFLGGGGKDEEQNYPHFPQAHIFQNNLPMITKPKEGRFNKTELVGIAKQTLKRGCAKFFGISIAYCFLLITGQNYTYGLISTMV